VHRPTMAVLVVIAGLALGAGCSSSAKSVISTNGSSGYQATPPPNATAPPSSASAQSVCSNLKAAAVAAGPGGMTSLAGVTAAQSAQLHAQAGAMLPPLQAAQSAATGTLAADLATVTNALQQLLNEPASSNQPSAALTNPAVQSAWQGILAYDQTTCGFNPAAPNG